MLLQELMNYKLQGIMQSSLDNLYIWLELLAGTVPANNLLLAGTDPANKLLLAGTPLKFP